MLISSICPSIEKKFPDYPNNWMGNLSKIKLFLYQYDISLDENVEIKNESNSAELS